LLEKSVAVVDGSGKAVTAFVIKYRYNEEDNIRIEIDFASLAFHTPL
jgi:hypothetical protein